MDKSLLERRTSWGRVFRDPSALALVFSNLLILYWAKKQGWSFGTFLATYWFQSVIIGFFTVLKIFAIGKFSTKGVRIDGESAQPNSFTRFFSAGFFVLHYGLFHFVYILVILGFGGVLDWQEIFLGAAIFFTNHGFSFIYHWFKERDQVQNIGKIMIAPYARILPMHLIIIFGFSLGQGALTFFVLLKTLMDVLMHTRGHFGVRISREFDFKG